MISFPRKISLARIPTPLEPLSRLSVEWGVELRVKRDDLTGTELTGNKIRKLEYLLADALEQECDSVITCGAVNSNHARATAIAARRLGLDPHLILAGEPPPAAGNLQLDLLVGATVQFITHKEYTLDIEPIFLQAANQLKQQGKKPYLIPTGGSNALGLVGYVEATQEIQEQCRRENWIPDYLVCAVGSGGTFAGLYLGSRIFLPSASVVGVLVCATADYFRKKIASDVRTAVKRYRWDVAIEESAIHLVEGYISGGYAKTDSNQMRFLRHVAQSEALILDPVYTGKALYGLQGEIRAGRIPAGAKILFIHTGGIYGLSAFAESLTCEWNSLHHWPE